MLVLTEFVTDHAEKLHDIPDEYLRDALPIAKKIAIALGCENYNILQVSTTFTATRHQSVYSFPMKNNGRIAHQEVDHVHFHVIPKPSAEDGLVIGWPAKKPEMSDLKKLQEELLSKL